MRLDTSIMLLFLPLFFAKTTNVSNVQYDVLFVFHDAGESLGLQPVVDSFLEDNQDMQIAILCLGIVLFFLC